MTNLEIILIIYLAIALIFSFILASKNWKKYLFKSKDKDISGRYISAMEMDKKTRYLVIGLLTLTITVFFPLVIITEYKDYMKGRKK